MKTVEVVAHVCSKSIPKKHGTYPSLLHARAAASRAMEAKEYALPCSWTFEEVTTVKYGKVVEYVSL